MALCCLCACASGSSLAQALAQAVSAVLDWSGSVCVYSGQMVDRSGLRTDRTGQTCQTGQDKTYIHADIVRLVRCLASVHLTHVGRNPPRWLKYSQGATNPGSSIIARHHHRDVTRCLTPCLKYRGHLPWQALGVRRKTSKGAQLHWRSLPGLPPGQSAGVWGGGKHPRCQTFQWRSQLGLILRIGPRIGLQRPRP